MSYIALSNFEIAFFRYIKLEQNICCFLEHLYWEDVVYVLGKSWQFYLFSCTSYFVDHNQADRLFTRLFLSFISTNKNALFRPGFGLVVKDAN